MYHVGKCSKTTEQQNELKPVTLPVVQILLPDKAPRERGFCLLCPLLSGLPWWLSGKEPAHQLGGRRDNPGLGRSPGEGNGNVLQYSCPRNPMDRGAWWATIHGVPKSQT